MKEKVFSIDGESYYQDIEDMIDEEIEYIYVADKVEYNHIDFVDSSILFQDMSDRAYDEAGEWSEDYLTDTTRGIERELNLVISNWLDSNVQEPLFFTVKNVNKIFIDDFKKGEY